MKFVRIVHVSDVTLSKEVSTGKIHLSQEEQRNCMHGESREIALSLEWAVFWGKECKDRGIWEGMSLAWHWSQAGNSLAGCSLLGRGGQAGSSVPQVFVEVSQFVLF